MELKQMARATVIAVVKRSILISINLSEISVPTGLLFLGSGYQLL